MSVSVLYLSNVSADNNHSGIGSWVLSFGSTVCSSCDLFICNFSHYENTPMQYTANFKGIRE